jgi:hypothetical protein
MNLTGIPLRSIPAGYPQRSAAKLSEEKIMLSVRQHAVVCLMESQHATGWEPAMVAILPERSGDV